ncbi:hypothetical protein [Microvirga mediterraneensis]|uniref:Uncharacterized protein n=1 Tax=Microvirga mediterraneensis TaxID=2754695 RepID=A0A838BQE1_9HYPH|nr:hypothetical protein [Microvirga mediterraneensis]MBA1157964.1 hypothetical protein [Microvirga mediterraneensis]
MTRSFHAPELHVVDDQETSARPGFVLRKLVGEQLPDRLTGGDLVWIDTTRKTPEWGCWIAVRVDGREMLGRFETGLRRPKDGPLEVWLGALDDGEEPRQRFKATPDFLEQHAIGHLAGYFKPDGLHAHAQHQWTDEDEAAVLKRIKEEEDAWLEEERQADEAAIKAKYRTRPIAGRYAPIEFTAPDLSRDQLHAPEGSCNLDAITRKLLNQGRICNMHLAENPFACVRSYVLSFANTALEITRLRSEIWPAQRRTAELIATRVDEMLQGMSDFLEHVRYEDTGYFISQEELDSDPSEEKEGATAVAESRLGDAREAVQLAICKLQAFRKPFRDEQPGHNGRKDVLVHEFLRGMAIAWYLLTSETAGKTGNGLFVGFCVSGWKLAGWPYDSDADLRSRFAKRIERGVHLR